MRAQMLRAAAALLPALVLGACEPAGTDLGFGSQETGEVGVIVYLDRDGSGTPTPLDTLYVGATVSLQPRAGGVAIATATTDAEGVAFFPEVKFGDYTISVSSASIGDSLVVANIDPDSIRVSSATNQVAAAARLAWPELSIREARTRAPGTLVFIRGTILVGTPFFSDLSAHLSDTSRALRMTGLTLLGGLAGNNPGDSVVVRGIVGQANGQPILSSARLIRVATRPAPIPTPVTSGIAASAQNGALDAALVNLTSITITDSMTTAPNFQVVASDGSGALTIVLDSNIPFNRLAFGPGRIMNIRGVLVPSGLGSWVLKPRVPGDVTFLN
jgi:hypothetical protein